MAQYDFGTMDPNIVTGDALAAILNSFRTALNTMHSGVTQPTYRQAGMIWLDTTAAQNPLIKFYDGTDWIILGLFNTTTNNWVPYYFNVSIDSQFGTGAPGGRLTLETLVPVSSADQLAKTTLYYTPYVHDRIGLYNTAGYWQNWALTERSLSLAGMTSGFPYDVFCFLSGSTPTLEILSWASATARTTALVLQNGVWCKTGALDRRYLGTISPSASGQCEDSAVNRLVWNMYNRVPRPMRYLDPTDSWTYTTNTFRQARGSAASTLTFVRGLNEDPVSARILAMFANSTVGVAVYSAIGLDSTTVPANETLCGVQYSYVAAYIICNTSFYAANPGIGRHTLTWLEKSLATGVTTFYGDGAQPSALQSGISAEVIA